MAGSLSLLLLLLLLAALGTPPGSTAATAAEPGFVSEDGQLERASGTATATEPPGSTGIRHPAAATGAARDRVGAHN